MGDAVAQSTGYTVTDQRYRMSRGSYLWMAEMSATTSPPSRRRKGKENWQQKQDPIP